MIKKVKRTAVRSMAVILAYVIELYRVFRPIPPQIYFCYNQSVHQIFHSLFIAIELSNVQKDYPVVVLSTSKDASRIIERELSSIPNNVRLITVRHHGYHKTNFSINWFVFLCRIRIHRPRAVVVTDYFDNVFRQLLLKTFWIYVFHGPENRGYTHPHIKDYDLIIVPSEKEVEKLESIVGPLNNYAVAGYSKFDYFQYHKVRPKKLFNQSKPIILYNPHFEQSQSSFFTQGLALLKALSEKGFYNIIFMPHPELSGKHSRQVHSAQNIPDLIIAEQSRSNLDYMAISDIYITDVSSSVFEWLYFNKPVIFFNTHNVDWKGRSMYPAWVCGRVAGDIPEMLDAIERSLQHPEEFEEQRKKIFSEMFPHQDKGVSKRIARIMWDKIKGESHKPQFFFFGNISESHGGMNKLVLPLAKKLSKQRAIHLVCGDADPSDFPGSEKNISRLNIFPYTKLLSFTPLRWGLKKMTFIKFSIFDYCASRYVKNSSPVYSFQGMSLHTFRKADKLGLKKILIASTLHIEFVWKQHKEEEKIVEHDYEWLGIRLKNKMLKEYEMADVIIVPSQLTRKTFLENGIDESKLEYIPYEVDTDFYKRINNKKDTVFRVLYVGRLTPQKGIHYLIRAFRELDLPGSELILFGGTATRKIKNWLRDLIECSDTIKVRSGDPRPAYEQASVLVHPSLNDNTGSTVTEALAYGLPVIVTENTGTKEFIKDGVNGFIIPIRDVRALKEKIRFYYEKNSSEEKHSL